MIPQDWAALALSVAGEPRLLLYIRGVRAPAMTTVTLDDFFVGASCLNNRFGRFGFWAYTLPLLHAWTM